MKKYKQTNEEWFNKLSTRKKAEWFTKKASFIATINHQNNAVKIWQQ